MAITLSTLLRIFVIAPLGALAFDRPLFGNWIWHIDLDRRGTISKHCGVPRQGSTPASQGLGET